MPKSKLTIITLTLIALTTTAFSCRCTPPSVAEKTKPIKLTWWRPHDSSADTADLINAYTRLHPHVSISYKKLRPEEYESVLINAWARDEGPDIFSLANTSIKKYQKNISPPPEKTLVPRLIVSGPSFNQTTEVIIQPKNFPTPNDIKNIFVPAVASNVVINNKVLALPLFVDTLALYYNRNLLNKAGVTTPPATWLDFKAAVQKLTLLDSDDNIVQAAAGIGAAANVSRSTDILSLLMLQNNADMQAINRPSGSGNSYYPGTEALIFYTSFSDPTKETYTWNSQMPEALDAFVNGQAAFYFGYSYSLPIIQARAPRLNFDIAPMVQISTNQNVATNLASFWAESVAKKSKNTEAAWDFLIFATNSEYTKQYLEKARKPTALRSLIIEQEKDYDLKPFVSQLLTSKSWYQGDDYTQVDSAFNEMITNASQGLLSPQDAINRAAQKISKTY